MRCFDGGLVCVFWERILWGAADVSSFECYVYWDRNVFYSHEINQFCSSHTLQEVRVIKFCVNMNVHPRYETDSCGLCTSNLSLRINLPPASHLSRITHLQIMQTSVALRTFKTFFSCTQYHTKTHARNTTQKRFPLQVYIDLFDTLDEKLAEALQKVRYLAPRCCQPPWLELFFLSSLSFQFFSMQNWLIFGEGN